VVECVDINDDVSTDHSPKSFDDNDDTRDVGPRRAPMGPMMTVSPNGRLLAS
jgi:hypothetical protein